jgi:murein DD-endopeptidase MepM/ murein hydrolase activator NlpD
MLSSADCRCSAPRVCARVIPAISLLLAGCVGPTPGPGGITHIVIGYDGAGERTLEVQPINGGRLSSPYGMRNDPFTGEKRLHRGLDYAANIGTPVRAAGDGIIVLVGQRGAYGDYVRIRHDARFETAYAHLGSYADGLERGTLVRQGDVIGYIGSTGRSTGPHLHYEILVDGDAVDPLAVDSSVAQTVTDGAFAALAAAKGRLSTFGATLASSGEELLGMTSEDLLDLTGLGDGED